MLKVHEISPCYLFPLKVVHAESWKDTLLVRAQLHVAESTLAGLGTKEFNRRESSAYKVTGKVCGTGSSLSFQP